MAKAGRVSRPGRLARLGPPTRPAGTRRRGNRRASPRRLPRAARARAIDGRAGASTRASSSSTNRIGRTNCCSRARRGERRAVARYFRRVRAVGDAHELVEIDDRNFREGTRRGLVTVLVELSAGTEPVRVGRAGRRPPNLVLFRNGSDFERRAHLGRARGGNPFASIVPVGRRPRLRDRRVWESGREM